MASEHEDLKTVYGALSVFILVIVADSVLVITGISRVMLDPDTMALPLLILFAVETMFCGIIITYSLGAFRLERRYRDLVLLLMAANMLLSGLFYVITNASMTSISMFANRDRNRTLVASFSLVLAPFALFGPVTNRETASSRQTLIALLWGGVIVPCLDILLFLSHEPAFVTTPEGMGLLGLSPISILILLLLIPTMINALIKYARAWIRERNKLDLATGLAMSLWMFSLFLFVLQSDPLQLMEIIWYSTFIVGSFLIAAVAISLAVVEPRQMLTSLVVQRTEELDQSKKESEFYLNLWGHKIGNLLQGMMTYLELLLARNNNAQQIENLTEIALDIGRQTNLINRQVAALIKVKEQEKSVLERVGLREALEAAITQTKESFGETCFSESILPDSEIDVLGDDMLALAFSSLFSYMCSESREPSISVVLEPKGEMISLLICNNGKSQAEHAKRYFLTGIIPGRANLNLDLFTAKILLDRYGVNIEIYVSGEESVFSIPFDRAEERNPEETVKDASILDSASDT